MTLVLGHLHQQATWDMCKTGHDERRGEGVAGANQTEEGSDPEQILPSYWKTNQQEKSGRRTHHNFSKQNTILWGFKDPKIR